MKEITSKDAKCRKITSYVIASIFLISFPVLTLAFFNTVEDYFVLVTCFFCAIMTVMLVAVCFLTRKLKRIGIECLKNSIASINCQYGLFVGVYIPFVFIDIIRVIYAEEVNTILDSVTFNVLDLAAKCFTIQIPLIYMLYIHRQTLARDESG